jgi:nitroreductase
VIATDSRDQREVYREAAEAGGYAPSVHNTQPWHWNVRRASLELWAVPERQLTNTDPDGRMMTVSCGAALHHARVALHALGYDSTVDVLPDPGQPNFLARITVAGHHSPDPAAMRHYQAVAIRHTDRRPVTGEPVPAAALDAIGAAIAGVDSHAGPAPGAHLHLMRHDQVIDLAAAASYAQRSEDADPALRAELDYWVGGERPTDLGVPDANLPDAAPQTTVPGRDFGRTGTLPVTAEHDRAASYGLLYTTVDDPAGWLTAGQALSAGWLAATELGVSVLPLSAVVEVPATRVRLREMLTADAYPQIVIRLGHADPGTQGPRPTPRLSSTHTIDVEPG